RAGGMAGRSRSRFTGRRVGRGGAAARLLRDRYAGQRLRRVVVKTRIVKLRAGGLAAARAHVRYLQRDGVSREGEPGRVYDAERDVADPKAFLDRCEDDRHQFRLIVAPEDADQYDELQGFTRRLISEVERDLGTRLEWIAVDHHNTGHPHSHVVIRGRDDTGKDLIIARDYLTRGMRERAQAVVTLDLGPRTDHEIEHRLRQEVEQDRLTSLDRGLIREAGATGLVDAGSVARGDHARFRRALKVGRLRKLERLGLAIEESPGLFRLSSELEPTLRRMGERGDIIRTMQRAVTERGLERGASDFAVHDSAERLVGRVVERGLSEELADRHYLIVDALDGRLHYADIGRADAGDPVREGMIVAVTGSAERTRASSVAIERLADRPLGELPTADAATWLDREPAAIHARTQDAGFGREVRAALRQRQQWLIEQGLAERRGDQVLVRRDLVGVLRRRELARVAATLSKELGLDYADPRAGDRVEGVYRRRVDLVSGRYAVIAATREFALVPWRPDLE
ncbi:MAG: DUF3363 domain-containing protein, partial [Alphaproteobacteria bacterium]|nr:DUF3363 domain-containing protein [Alphaproteobacteria bacterium]